jgi:hypothetical protein
LQWTLFWYVAAKVCTFIIKVQYHVVPLLSSVARIRIERNDVPSLENFQTAVEKDAEDTDNDLQILKFELSMTTARNVKFVILKSYDHFVTIHSIVITGRTTTS